MLNRPEITEERLVQIRQIIRDNPDWNRTRISRHICEVWDWRVPGGQIKDISCRDMLRALDKSDLIELPAQQSKRRYNTNRTVKHKEHDTTKIECLLDQLQPLTIEVVEWGTALEEFKSRIDQYHYLGFDRTVGENMKYIARSKDGDVLACLLFGSAAWKCRDRDAFITWDLEQRTAGLQLLTNNTRFLIMPWVRVPHLASHILSLISHRISADWEKKYGHPILMLETFVECGRFRGSCYKAANWICVGRTTGRGRDDRKHAKALPEKDIYLLPLTRRWKRNLLIEKI